MQGVWTYWYLSTWLGALWWPVPATRAQDNFYFNPQPSDRSVITGQNVTLDCDVSNRRHITFYWTRDGEVVLNTTRRYQIGSKLHFTRVDPTEDFGEFKCIATNMTTGISITSQRAQLNILWIGETARVVLQSPENGDQIQEGDELILRCKVDGSSEVQYEWFYNGFRMDRSDRVSFRNKKQHASLHITGLTAADNGVYSCRVISEVGELNSTENFALTVYSEAAARIVRIPKDVTVPQDGSALFDCVYENAAVTEWYAQNGDVPLTNNSRHTVFPNGSLYISPVKEEDKGLYRCVGISALSKDAPLQTYVAQLHIAYLGDLDDSLLEPPLPSGEHPVVPENSQYEITCMKPNGHPLPRMWWEDPTGHVISDSGNVRVDNMRLIITKIKKEDSGNYTCFAENMAGQTRKTVEIYVATGPLISSHPVNDLVDEGETGSMVCDYFGSPYPITTVKWLKNDSYVRESPSHYIVHQHNGTLFIKNVMLSDSGLYKCEVNTTGFPPIYSNEATLFVKEKLKFVPPPVSRNLELSSTAKIYCKARGATKPVVKWIKEGGQFLNEWPPHVKDENGTLHFNVVKNSDAGRYMCVATNSQGIINATIDVDVTVMPKFKVQPADTEAYEGYPVMLHCGAEGVPHPTIQWDKNSVLNGFDEKRFVVMENGTLFVSETHMDDQGKYGCTAGNSGGFKRAEVSLIVKSAEDYSPNYVGKGGNQGESTMTKTVTITLGAAAIYMILVMGLMIWCRLRRARRKALLLAQATAEVAKIENGDIPLSTEVRNQNTTVEAKESGTNKSDGEVHSHSSSTHSHHSRKSRSSYDKIQFPRHDLQTMMLLGRGEYGDVFLAKAQGIKEGEAESTVMVKALQIRDETLHFEYKREMDMFHKLDHDNIAKLLGVCRDSEPFFMIMEYSDWGDLKQFLLATRKDNQRKGPKPPPLTVPQIVGVCHQVAIGMEYLSNHRFTHKDLATRNCLVSSHLDVKITSPSLSRDTYAQEYFQHHNRAVSLRWAPSEAVLEDEWSTKSDVWSFAVLVWEVFTQAEMPYSDLNDEAVLRLLKKQELQCLPLDSAPEALGELLSQCWSPSPKDRPSFNDITTVIGGLNVDSKV